MFGAGIVGFTLPVESFGPRQCVVADRGGSRKVPARRLWDFPAGLHVHGASCHRSPLTGSGQPIDRLKNPPRSPVGAHSGECGELRVGARHHGHNIPEMALDASPIFDILGSDVTNHHSRLLCP